MSGFACVLSLILAVVLCVQWYAAARRRVHDYDGKRVPDQGEVKVAKAIIQGRNETYARFLTPSIAGASVPEAEPAGPPPMDGAATEEKLSAPPKPPWES